MNGEVLEIYYTFPCIVDEMDGRNKVQGMKCDEFHIIAWHVCDLVDEHLGIDELIK